MPERGTAPIELTPTPQVEASPAAPPLDPAAAAALVAAVSEVPQAVSQPVVPLPDTAADQDLIEPEWVDKTEAVLKETAGNPYAEEEAIENLQVDYLQKRYGHSVKKPDETN